MARPSTKSRKAKSKEPEIISVDDILADKHVKVLTPTDKRLTFFVRLANNQVWEINPTTKPMKALLREYNVDNFAMSQVWPDQMDRISLLRDSGFYYRDLEIQIPKAIDGYKDNIRTKTILPMVVCHKLCRVWSATGHL